MSSSRALARPNWTDALASVLLGEQPGAPSLPTEQARAPATVLRELLPPLLQRTPCVVSFSGGRDSSAVLALAVHVAREHGLPDPIPATLRHPGDDTQESEWQELVLKHLDVRHFEVLQQRDEQDLLGDAAVAALRAHGVLWPANAYWHTPILELARGGVMLTGIGGDEALGTRSGPWTRLRHGTRPRRGELRALLAGVAPRRVHELVERRTGRPQWPWLTEAGARHLGRAFARSTAAWPDSWDATIRHWYSSRAFAATDGVLGALGRPYDAVVVNPLLSPPFLAALAREGGPTGFPSRDAAMTHLFQDVLPPELLTRASKASFSSTVWGPHARQFASEWDGSGLDQGYVDVQALRLEWLAERPDFRSALLLHWAWLSADRR